MKLAKMVGSYGRAGLITFCCLQGAACGLLFTKGPPSEYESLNYFTCSEGRVGPTLDLVWAGLNIVGAAAVTDQTANDAGTTVSQVRTIELAEGLLWGTSGIVGYRKVAACREAKADLADIQSSSRKPRSSLELHDGIYVSTVPPSAKASRALSPIPWLGLKPLSEELATQRSHNRDK